jgi:FMN phosphatase YigB (HAD superfamily)
MSYMKETEMKNNNIEIFIFDMDGTLYELDGEGGTFKNSTLFKNVILNSIEFVIAREGCTREFAENMIEEAQNDEIGISNFLAKRYGITRAHYFDIVWNISPKIVIKNPEEPVKAIKRLKDLGKKLFLLTAAPRIWMENVVNELGLSDHFERKFHGEMFIKKDEIFEQVAGEFDPSQIISIGDQLETDLIPAAKFGISVLHITRVEDINKLI